MFTGGKQATSERVLASFEEAVDQAYAIHQDDFGGYVVISWDMEGRFYTFLKTDAPYPRLNDLPGWIAEAIRRYLAEHEARNLLPG
jgi:hypothetical protein